MPENREALELWNACATQWRIGGMGIPVGLDYPAVFRVAEILDIDVDRAMLTKIRALEHEHIKKSCETAKEG